MNLIMKTYSRKKISEIDDGNMDLDAVCRLCMIKEEELISIFNNEESVPLTFRIMACVALEVIEGDGLPEKICHPCKFQLEKSYKFRKKCEESDMKLRLHLNDVKKEIGDIIERDNGEDSQTFKMEVEEIQVEDTVIEKELIKMIVKVEPTIEDDLGGVANVDYIQQPHTDPEKLPSNITLPPDADSENKKARILKNIRDIKSESEEDVDGNVIIIEEKEPNTIDGTNMDAIADAVKATLSSQIGLNLSGQLQLKVSHSEGKTAQAEVTTKAGRIIVMGIMTGDPANTLAEIPSREDVDEKVFQCPDCPKTFTKKIELRRHTSVHMQHKGFTCGTCEKWFPTRSALIRHERIHTGERPFQCEVCQRCFTQKEIMLRHLMTHSGPVKCPHCSQRFSQKEQLKVHISTHGSKSSKHLLRLDAKKPFKSTDCEKTFMDGSSLRRHHIHTGHQS